MNNIKEYNKILNKNDFASLQNLITSVDFPWFYSPSQVDDIDSSYLFHSLFHKNNAILAPVHSLIYNESINNYYTQLFKSIKQKDVRNLLIYYKKKFSLESSSSNNLGNIDNLINGRIIFM